MSARHLLVLSLCLGCFTACNITDSSVTPPSPTQDQTPDAMMDQGTDQRMDQEGDQSNQDMMGDDLSARDQAMDLDDMPTDQGPDTDQYPCAYPSDDPTCKEDAYGPGTFLTTFTIVKDSSCCRDFNGDGRADNQLGALLVSLDQLAKIDINTNIEEGIKKGTFVYLMEAQYWSNERTDPMLTLGFVMGKDTNDNITDNLDGKGSFKLFSGSFDANLQPIERFKQVQIKDYELSAKEGAMTLALPGLLTNTGFPVDDLSMTATVKTGAKLSSGGGFALDDIKFAGYITKENLFGTLNQVANRCTCLRQDIFKNDNGRYSCVLEKDLCQQDANEDCRTVGTQSLCRFTAMISDFADLDANNDGEKNAYSIAFTAKSVPIALER